MTTQPEALRLADALETLSPLEREAAAQLRRLYEVNQELLEALKETAQYVHDKSHCTWMASGFVNGCRCVKDCSSISVWKKADGTIAKATGEQA